MVSTPTVRVVPLIDGTGDGGYTIVTPSAVAFVGPGDPVAQSVLDLLVRRADASGELAERLMNLLEGTSELRYPAVVAVGSDASGHDVVVSGGGSALASGVRHADGTAQATVAWPPTPSRPSPSSDRPLHVRVAGIAALTVGAPADAGSGRALLAGLTDLRDATMRSHGFVATWATERDAAASPSPAPGDTWRSAAPSGPPSTPAPPAPLATSATPVPLAPLAPRRPPPSDRPRQTREIRGVLCGRHHFNEPAARFCARCGLSIPADSRAVAMRQRPAVGRLRFDTGEVFDVAGDIVVGRAAADDSLVACDAARALTPRGDVSGLSRTHATIRLRGLQVDLVDRNSLNGTFRWHAASGRWDRLAPGVPVAIDIGDAIAFGRRTATFESADGDDPHGSDVEPAR